MEMSVKKLDKMVDCIGHFLAEHKVADYYFTTDDEDLYFNDRYNQGVYVNNKFISSDNLSYYISSKLIGVSNGSVYSKDELEVLDMKKLLQNVNNNTYYYIINSKGNIVDLSYKKVQHILSDLRHKLNYNLYDKLIKYLNSKGFK